MSKFTKRLPEWNKPGIEPPNSKKTVGWQVDERPPAEYLNWLANQTFESLKELQDNAAHKEETEQLTAQLAESVNYLGDNVLGVPDTYLNIPSTLGNGLATHPSVIDFGEGKWNGYRYWMAFTPYPGIKNENPCIAVSNDNVTWVVPIGVTNPLVPAPVETNGYNSDTDMIYIKETNKLRIYYRQFGVNSNTQIFYIESSDGVNWSAPTTSLDEANVLLSPSIIKESNNLYKMWYVLNVNTFGYRTSTDGVNWSTETVLNQPWNNKGVWHIGVIKGSDGIYHLLGSAYNAHNEEGVQYRPIYYAYSNDGLTWIANETPQIIPSGWANGYLYRPSFIIDESKGLKKGLPYVKVWFSAATSTGNWHIGYTEGFLLNHINETASDLNRQRKNLLESFTGLFAKIKAGTAFVSNLVAGIVNIKNPFDTPRLSFKDDRIASPNGSEAQIQWAGHTTDDSNRLRFSFSKAGEPLAIKFQISPFSNWVGFVSPGSLANVREINTIGQAFQIVVRDSNNISNVAMSWSPSDKAWNFNNLGIRGIGDLRATRIIAYNDGIRIYKQDDTVEHIRLYGDATGSLRIISSTQGTDYFRFRADGDLQSNNAGIMDLEYTNYKPQTSRPANLTAARPGVYCADGVTHNPCNVTENVPYLVFWNGSTYTKIG